jgi:hypothetical protein
MSSSRSSQNGDSCTNTERTLLEIRHMIWSIPLPTLLYGFRELLVDPSIQLSAIVLPSFVNNSPRMDQMMAAFLQYTYLFPLRIIHRISSSVLMSPFGESQRIPTTTPDLTRDMMMTSSASSSSSSTVSSSSKIQGPRFSRPIKDSTSTIRGAWAFLYSASSDVISAWLHPQKMLQWADALTQFRNYLQSSDMASILEEAILRPLYGGRLWDNLQLLQQWQEMNDDANPGTRILSPAHPILDNNNTPNTSNDMKCIWDVSLASHLMRFATAAYGAEMIKSAIDQDVSVYDLMTERQAIALHTRIPESDIRYIHVQEGNPIRDDNNSSTAHNHSTTLRYFIAVDHSYRAIVLALRGTLSISGALVDLQGMDVPFCFGGRAHKGIAELAMAIWDECGPLLRELWDELDSYDLIVTGHSLGAGAACLLHLLLYADDKFERCKVANSSSYVTTASGMRRILCFGFAPPPTYWRDESINTKEQQQQQLVYQEAIEHCWCYIHDCDCVPFLSVASLRRLALLLDATDEYSENVWFWNRALIIWGWKSYPKELSLRLQQAQTQQQQQQQDHQDPPLFIPAKFLVWGKQQQQQQQPLKIPSLPTSKNKIMIAKICDPKVLVHRNIILGESMFLHHLPEQYENSLNSLVEQNTST